MIIVLLLLLLVGILFVMWYIFSEQRRSHRIQSELEEQTTRLARIVESRNEKSCQALFSSIGLDLAESVHGDRYHTEPNQRTLVLTSQCTHYTVTQRQGDMNIYLPDSSSIPYGQLYTILVHQNVNVSFRLSSNDQLLINASDSDDNANNSRRIVQLWSNHQSIWHVLCD